VKLTPHTPSQNPSGLVNFVKLLCAIESLVLYYASPTGIELPREGFTLKITISPPIQNPAHQVLGEMHKPAKQAQIDPNFFQLLHVPPTPNFTPIQYSRHLLRTLFIFMVILFGLIAKIIFPQPNFKPSTHFTHSHTYLPCFRGRDETEVRPLTVDPCLLGL
jgi:hypothetical protein